jgi:nucleoside-diphosphate-sugar epimerase
MSEVQKGPPSNEFELIDRLTTPTADCVDAASRLHGDVLLLGAGGKLGPSLALLLHRSLVASGSQCRVVCVSRFSDAGTAMMLGRAGIRTIAADLMDRKELDRLPDAPYVYHLAGSKFGTTGNAARTWAMNALLPAMVAERFRSSSIVALSTGNVYPFVPPASGGATEDAAPGPVGEYAQSCLARERVLEYVSAQHGTGILLVRLNYACDLRYGVPVDIAQRVASGQPVDLTMGYFNVLWQGDVNRILIRAAELCSTPPTILNLTGPETISVRDAAARLAAGMGFPPPSYEGTEQGSALLSNAGRCWRMYGPPNVTTDQLLEWTAHWVRLGGSTLNKPTHFEVTDGRF